MNCPNCTIDRSSVIDSRTGALGDRIRRRRSCMACGHRWTTYEVDAALLHAMSTVTAVPGMAKLKAMLAAFGEALQEHEQAAAGALEEGRQRYYFDQRRLTFPGTPAPKPVEGEVVANTGEYPVNNLPPVIIR